MYLNIFHQIIIFSLVTVTVGDVTLIASMLGDTLYQRNSENEVHISDVRVKTLSANYMR